MWIQTEVSMRKLIGPLVAACLLVASPAHAALFTLDSYAVSLRTTDPGLVLFEDKLLGTPTTFTLDTVGEQETFTLFRIGTTENALNLDDAVPYSIEVAFGFGTPLPGFGGTTKGITGAGWFLGSFGYVLFDNPLVLEFGNYGRLGVSLENATFGLPGSTSIDATFTLLRADGGNPPTGVPEPSSAALFGFGALAIAAFRRRRVGR